jgi:hypothetical protein
MRAMEADLVRVVTLLNKDGDYDSAAAVQTAVIAVSTARISIEAVAEWDWEEIEKS